MGASALEGQKGIISVKKGWKGLNEVNWVVYDPQQITVTDMEQRLKQAGTYIKTVER